MAVQEHVDVTRQGVSAIAGWRLRNPRCHLDLSNAELTTLDLRYCDLSGANLLGASFDDSDLSMASLRSANLRHLRAHRAKLRAADLSDADLSEADLNRSDLHACNLVRAKLNLTLLRSTTLTDAILHDASMSSSDLTDAVIGGTVFGDADLRLSSGLETLYHTSPSTLGCGALLNYYDDLPLQFLKGCNIPDYLLTYLQSKRSTSSRQYHSCFISYAHEDCEFAYKLHRALTERGVHCWIDKNRMRTGGDILTAIHEGIHGRDRMLLCCSEASLTGSWWVRRELEKAAEKELTTLRVTGQWIDVAIALDIDGFFYKWSSPHRSWLAARVVGDFTKWSDSPDSFNCALEQLLKALEIASCSTEALDG